MVRAAPVGRRAGAFIVDLVVLVAGLAVSALFLAQVSLTYVVVAFVGYHTAFGWLTGTTPGKAAFGLRLERLDGRAYQIRPLRLPWLLARSAVGYLVVDVFGVGLVAAALLPQRRPLHDVVFRSVVVADPAPEPRVRARLEAFETRLQQSADEVRWPRRPLTRLVAWLVGGLLALRSGIDMVGRWGAWLGRRIRRGRAPTTAAPASSASLAVTAGVLAVTAAISATVWARLHDTVWEQQPSSAAADDQVVAGGGAPPTGSPSTRPAPGVTLADLRSAPVPAMCDNPAGRATDGMFRPPGGDPGAATAIAWDPDPTYGIFTADGWRGAVVGDLDGDGGDEAVTIVSCTFGGSLHLSQAVVYGAGPKILAVAPLSPASAVRISDGAVDVVGLTPDDLGNDPNCCPSVVTAQRYQLRGGRLVEASPARLDASQPLTPGAWGALRIGSSYADAALYLGEPIDLDDTEGNGVAFSAREDRCLFAMSADDNASIVGTSDRTMVLSLNLPGAHTDKGVGVGSTEQALRRAYGSRLVTLDDPNQSGRLFVGDPRLTDGAPALRFTLDPSTRRVTSMAVGAYPDVTNLEGCV